MKRYALLLAMAVSISAVLAQTPAKNVIFFFGDGVGVSSLNAASIYGYGRPQALYLQRVANVALADTSTTKEWVPDAAASATAMATGVKTRNGVVSQTAAAIKDARDGENLKTIFEYAKERGLSTGIISNDDRTGVTIAAVAAFYAHSNNRQRSSDIFQQILNPKIGIGPDIVIGTGLKWISAESVKAGHNLESEITATGYAYVHSIAEVKQLDPGKDRLIALFDDSDFNLSSAVDEAVSRLSKNPKGYILVVFSDCHLPAARKTLSRIVEFDKVFAATAERTQKDTLVLMSADHSFDLRIKGESLVETSRAADSAQVAAVISLENQHTAEEVPVIAVGPGANRVRGFISNTDVFHIMMGALGWEKYRQEAKFPVTGEGSWDYIALDSDARRLYVSHESQVNVLDADSGRAIGVIPDTPGVHGAAIVPAQNRGFTSNGREDKVSIFDLATLNLIRKVSVGNGPDGIYFNAASNRVFTNNHGSHDITALDAATGDVVGTVKLEGDGEQAVVAANGLVYVNSENSSEVVAFDPKTLQVKSRFPLTGGKTPTGLAYDAVNNRLFVGCRSANMLVIDAAGGNVVASLPIGKGVDAAAWDPDSKIVFFSNSDGVLNLFRQRSANEYEDLGPIMTQPSAKTMAFDPKTRRVYLPAADVEIIPAQTASGRPQRKIRPGSFAVLVLRPTQRPTQKP